MTDFQLWLFSGVCLLGSFVALFKHLAGHSIRKFKEPRTQFPRRQSAYRW